ncbi:unnamed protein product [Prunus armeniaca]|nr:hypothetical protein GBA52_005822 [Prunus armeniaca]
MVFVTVCLFEEAGLRLRPSSQAKEWGLFVCVLWLVACGLWRKSYEFCGHAPKQRVLRKLSVFNTWIATTLGSDLLRFGLS